MRTLSFLFASLIAISPACDAADDPLGFDADVSVSGFFSPEIKKISILNVYENSFADKAGLKKGDTVIELDGCVIPGCDANIAKNSLEKTSGDTLALLVKHMDGKQELISIILD